MYRSDGINIGIRFEKTAVLLYKLSVRPSIHSWRIEEHIEIIIISCLKSTTKMATTKTQAQTRSASQKLQFEGHTKSTHIAHCQRLQKEAR